MTLMRPFLALALGLATVPISFLLSRAVLTEWYLRTLTHGDGQVGLSIFFGSLLIALIFGLAVFGVILIIGRKGR